MLVIYFVILLLLTIYSYVLVDPNITLVNSIWWEKFRNIMVQIGYHNRELSWFFYLLIILAAYIFYYYFQKRYKKINPLKVGIATGILLLLSYPFLSHDLFNYMFDARIFTFYGENPYIHSALDYPNDHWLRFMHWTHRPYPYGPTFLIITIIPSFLSFGKLILNFILFKLMWVGFYLLGIYFLNKKDKLLAIVFATHPYVLIEGLVNTHNDFIAASLGIIGMYYLLETKKTLWGRIVILLSGGIKYITAPLFFIQKKNKHVNTAIVILILGLIVYLAFFKELQQWYFLSIFVFLILFPKLIQDIEIFLFGLLLSYYPFIRLGGWGAESNVELKNKIILLFFVLNIVYYFLNKNRHQLARRFTVNN